MPITAEKAEKIAFVTGANRGLGLETARQLGQKGVFVIIGARKAEAAEKTVAALAKEGIKADALAFDITKPADHKAAAKYIGDAYGRLDILVNNAGVFLDSSGPAAQNNASTVEQKVLRDTFETNFFGVVSLTQALLPLIRKSKAGRIVNLSSILGSLSLHADSASPIYDNKALAYNASKTALNAFTIHLAHELKDTAIKVNSAHPGWVKTDMGGAEAPLEVAEGGRTSAQLALLGEDGPTGGFFHLGQPLPW